tara:strand:- start:215 stop:358 length:144 start_codon:yes stop_codon:yes gene_type:complete
MISLVATLEKSWADWWLNNTGVIPDGLDWIILLVLLIILNQIFKWKS